MIKRTHFSISIVMTLVMAIAACAYFTASEPIKAYAEGSERRDLLGEGTDYTSILYDSTNGLPTSEANAIAQSRDGFIWLGGYSGLIRYDGTTFNRFDSSSGISSVFSLYVDSKDRVWIGTNENGVAYYDKGDIHIYGRVEGLKSYSIRAITEDRDGNIIIATTQGIAYIGNEDLEIHVIDDPQVNTEYITRLLHDDRGNIYGLTLNGAVFEVKDLRISAFYEPDHFGDDIVNTIYPDPDAPGYIIMGTQGQELLTVNADAGMKVTGRKSLPTLKNINSVLKNGDITWISATNGIGYLDEKGAYADLTDIPMNNSIGNIMKDHEGNMWFTSTRQGVLKLVPDRFTDLSRLANLDSMVVNSTCLSEGKLYIGTDNGLTIINATTYAPVSNSLTELMDNVRIRCIKKDSKDNVWLCTHGDTGLVCYNPSTGDITCYNSENGIDAGRVRACTELSDGSIAAATGNGVFIVRGGEVVDHYGQDKGISNTEILSVEEGPDGRLYMGSDGDGIYVYDGSMVSRLGLEDGLTSEVIMRIKWDADREMFWFITSNSIQYMKDGEISAVTSFPYSNNYDIYFNSHGGAWILSSNGIYVTRTDELIADEHIEYTFYNTKSGLPYIATGNSRSCLSDDGMLYISGTTGVCLVDIEAEFGNNDAVKLAIPSIVIDDRVVPVGDSEMITIPAGSRRIDINAYALTYGLSNPRISYMLAGFDDEPVITTKQEMKTISYTNLDGGKYTFHLNVINDETGDIDKTIHITLNKESSIYESVWFWVVLMAAAVIGLAFVMYNYFQKKNRALIAKQEADRKFINQIIHTFAKCIDMRDTQNQGHSFRVAYYTRLLATKLADKRGYTDDQINEFYNIALLHDIGKLSIPDSVLNKPSRLNDEEYEIMKSHAAKGAEILKEVNIVKDLSVGAGCHHERIDGKGYPNGLAGNEIPEVARIIAVADTFDAMYSTRPYRKQLDINVVLEEIRRIRGTQLEEEVVDALLELCDEGEIEWNKVNEAIKNGAPASSRVEPVSDKNKDKDKNGKDSDTNDSAKEEGVGVSSGVIDNSDKQKSSETEEKDTADKHEADDKKSTEDDTSDFQKSLGLF